MLWIRGGCWRGLRLATPAVWEECLTYAQQVEFLANKIRELEEKVKELEETNAEENS